jgi:hypothetical protein
VAALFAGCSSPRSPVATAAAHGTEVPVSAATPTFSDATGAVDGVATDDALNPLGGAQVTIVGTQSTVQSLPDGHFVFSNLGPGPIVVSGAKDGFEMASEHVDVQAGRATSVHLVLVASPVKEPYSTTQQAAGVLTCGADINETASPYPGYVGQVSTIPCQYVELAQSKLGSTPRLYTLMKVRVNESSGMWAETAWKPNDHLSNGMAVVWNYLDAAQHQYMVNHATGPTPVRQMGLAAKFLLQNGSYGCAPDACGLSLYHYPYANAGSSSGSNVVVTFFQRFTDYVTVFYNGPVPPDFTALPQD